MENSSQDQITMHSEKTIEFSMLESDPDSDSQMSGSDFEETTRRSQGRHIRFVPEQLTEEHTITTIETQQPARAVRMPKSRTAKAGRSRQGTPMPATDVSMTSSEAQFARPALVRRFQSQSVPRSASEDWSQVTKGCRWILHQPRSGHGSIPCRAKRPMRLAWRRRGRRK